MARCISLCAYGTVEVGDEVCALPSATADGFIVAVQAAEPFFRVLTARDHAPDDVAWIEFDCGRLVITPCAAPPTTPAMSRYGARETCYVNGLELRRPLEVWPGSRLALGLSQRFFFVRPSADAEQRMPALRAAAASAAYLAMLRRQVLMSHHLDQQALRIMRADQGLARLDREADVLGKQAAAMELKQANSAKRVKGLRDQSDMVARAITEEREALAAEARARGNDEDEDEDEDKGKHLAELKSELKKLREQCTDLELSSLDSKAESARTRREEAKTRAAFDRLAAAKVELQSRVAEVTDWLALLAPSLAFAHQHMSADARAEIPTKKAVLAHFFPPAPPPPPRRGDNAEGAQHAEEDEDVDERPTVDAVLSDPATFEAQRWLAHLLAVSEVLDDLPRPVVPAPTAQAIAVAAVPALFLSFGAKKRPDPAKEPEPAKAPEPLVVKPVTHAGRVGLEIAMRELRLARPLALAEVKDAAAFVGSAAAKDAQQAMQTVMPFAVKQRVTCYEASSGAWLTARVLSCTPTTVEVALEDTKRERSCPVKEVHDWLEHLRGHPHLWQAWKDRAPKSSSDPRDRAPILGILLRKSEPQERRMEWYVRMRPKFERLIASDRAAKVFLEALHRRPWSHRYPIWRDARYHVIRPRLPNPVTDGKGVRWVVSMAPKTLLAIGDAEGPESEDEFEQEEDEEELAKRRKRAARSKANEAKKREPTKEELMAIKVKAAQAKAAEVAKAADKELDYFYVHEGNRSGLAELLRISSGGHSRHVMVFGAVGSGKQSAVALLVRKTLSAQVARAERRDPSETRGVEDSDERAAVEKWVSHGSVVMELSEALLKSDTKLKDAIVQFSKRPLHPSLFARLSEAVGPKKANVTRFIVLNHLDKVPATLQMALTKNLAEAEAHNCRFVLVADDASLVVGPLRASLLAIGLAKLPVGAWLERLLCVCASQRVGWEREGIELVVQLANGDLGAAVDLVQQTFLRTSFVSRANVAKAAGEMLEERNAKRPVNRGQGVDSDRGKDTSENEPPPPPPLRQPIDPLLIASVATPVPETHVLGKGLRCAICTLPPPCKHISGPGLLRLARDRVKALPRNPALPLCPSFAATGACEALNELGYCRCDHPSHLWDFVPLAKRCPCCTVPEPCNVCPWLKLRRAVGKVTARAAEQLAALKHRGERSTVTLAKFRTLFNAEVDACEKMLDDQAKWLNVSQGRMRVHDHITDLHLVKPPYTTNAAESRARLQQLKKRWELSRQKLGLWLEGQSARHLTKQVEAVDKVVVVADKKPSHFGVANVAARRYMPSSEFLVGDRNGVAAWEPPSCLPRESPLLEVNWQVLKLGLRAPKAEGEAEGGYETGEAEASRLRAERVAAEAKEKANEARKSTSIFAK